MGYGQQARKFLSQIPEVDFSNRSFAEVLRINAHFHNPAYTVKSGCFRIVIIPRDIPDFVIKTMDPYSSGDKEQFATERNLYMEAKAVGLHEYFAQPFTSFYYQEREFVAFERADFILASDEGHKLEKASTYDRFFPYSEYFLSDTIAERLGKFIDKFHISDLHAGNIGYSRKKNHPIFIDYTFCKSSSNASNSCRTPSSWHTPSEDPCSL